MQTITDNTLSEIEADYLKWAEFLNLSVGLLSFSTAISCLGTPRPDITAFLSLFFNLLFMAYGRKKFPEKVRELRKAQLVGMDHIKLLGIEHKYFSFGAMVRYFPVFLAGWFFLGGVAIYGVLKYVGWLG